MNEIIQLPVPIYPKLVDILAERQKAQQAELAGIAAMANTYDQVCAILRNYEVKQEHYVKIYPKGIVVRISLAHNDLVEAFLPVWRDLYFVLKPAASLIDVPAMVGTSWGPELNAVCRANDGRWLELTLELPIDGTRDHRIVKEVVPSTTSRYIHHALSTTERRALDWYEPPFEDEVPF